MNKEIFCTLGPASLNDSVVTRFEEIGISLFRLNLSHTRLKELTQIIQYLHSRTSVPVCLDTEGAQVRTGSFVQGKIYLREKDSGAGHEVYEKSVGMSGLERIRLNKLVCGLAYPWPRVGVIDGCSTS